MPLGDETPENKSGSSPSGCITLRFPKLFATVLDELDLLESFPAFILPMLLIPVPTRSRAGLFVDVQLCDKFFSELDLPFVARVFCIALILQNIYNAFTYIDEMPVI